ncbi:uncharacterized protein si:ch211-188c16.1 isoform X1 [Astyanax mexicanus]|uniref:uncharacterized protein si:ch211-188c16.1 isoform X1 n=1 Tax=Astyanax mexicanus TaxID=7994 RepID=UPI0020CACD79|nr:uncharacterized protein si:ch211-188c16.1 isoform X1 [Astyanax mexicanus]
MDTAIDFKSLRAKFQEEFQSKERPAVPHRPKRLPPLPPGGATSAVYSTPSSTADRNHITPQVVLRDERRAGTVKRPVSVPTSFFHHGNDGGTGVGRLSMKDRQFPLVLPAQLSSNHESKHDQVTPSAKLVTSPIKCGKKAMPAPFKPTKFSKCIKDILEAAGERAENGHKPHSVESTPTGESVPNGFSHHHHHNHHSQGSSSGSSPEQPGTPPKPSTESSSSVGHVLSTLEKAKKKFSPKNLLVYARPKSFYASKGQSSPPSGDYENVHREANSWVSTASATYTSLPVLQTSAFTHMTRAVLNLNGDVRSRVHSAGPPPARRPLPDLGSLGALPVKPHRPPQVDLSSYTCGLSPETRNDVCSLNLADIPESVSVDVLDAESSAVPPPPPPPEFEAPEFPDFEASVLEALNDSLINLAALDLESTEFRVPLPPPRPEQEPGAHLQDPERGAEVVLNPSIYPAVDLTGPEQSYSAPQQSYSAPQQSYNAPQQSYNAPEQSYNAPQQSYNAPEQSYNAPQQSYNAPEQSYNAPEQSYNAPEQSYNAPQQCYSTPEQWADSWPDVALQPEATVEIPNPEATSEIILNGAHHNVPPDLINCELPSEPRGCCFSLSQQGDQYEVCDNVYEEVETITKLQIRENSRKRKDPPKNPYAESPAREETYKSIRHVSQWKERLSPEHQDEKEQRKREKQRLEREKKEQKEREKKENLMKKKFKITGQEEPMYHARVLVTSKLRKHDLQVTSGDTVSIIRTTNCPKGKWLARDAQHKYGYISVMNVELNMKEMLELGKRASQAAGRGPGELDTLSLSSRSSHHNPVMTSSFTDDSEEWSGEDETLSALAENMGPHRAVSMPDVFGGNGSAEHVLSAGSMEDIPSQVTHVALQKLAVFFQNSREDLRTVTQCTDSESNFIAPGLLSAVEEPQYGEEEQCSFADMELLPPPDLYADSV